MSEPVRYRTTMHLVGRATGVPVPAEVLDRLGGGRRPAVRAVVNGYAFSGTVGAMGGQALLSFSAEKRAESGIAGGDDLEVELAMDDAPRVVEVPDDLRSALDEAGVTAVFDGLAPSARKAHVTNVTSAKALETRQRRIEGIVAKLRG